MSLSSVVEDVFCDNYLYSFIALFLLLPSWVSLVTSFLFHSSKVFLIFSDPLTFPLALL